MNLNEIEYALKVTLSVASLLGCGFIIFTVIFFKELWISTFRLILYLAVSNMILPVSFLLPYGSNSKICTAQGFLNNFGVLSSLLWTACIMHSLYKLIVYEEIGNKKNERIFMVICWVVPLILSSVVINQYEPAEGWCWIKQNILLYIGEFYGPYILVVLYNISVCIRIHYYLKKSVEPYEVIKIKKAALKKFLFYPVSLVICFIPIILHRFYESMFDEPPPEILTILGIVGNTIYGVCCFAIYLFTKLVRSKVLKICCLSKSPINLDEELVNN
jgi:Slime mold cyclic AMP receptor